MANNRLFFFTSFVYFIFTADTVWNFKNFFLNYVLKDCNTSAQIPFLYKSIDIKALPIFVNIILRSLELRKTCSEKVIIFTITSYPF